MNDNEEMIRENLNDSDRMETEHEEQRMNEEEHILDAEFRTCSDETVEDKNQYVFSGNYKEPEPVRDFKQEKKAAKDALKAANRADKAHKKAQKAKRRADRRTSGPVRKIAVALACGLAFGTAAGGGVAAVNEATGFLREIGANANQVNTDEIVNKVLAEASSVSANTGDSASIQKVVSPVYSANSNASVADIVSSVMPGMVAVYNNYTATYSSNYFSFYGFNGGSRTEELTSTGSGIIIGTNETEYLIVTNNHVVDGANSLEVEFVDGTKVAASLKGTNASMDLAVIAVAYADLSADTMSKISVVSLGSSDELVLGEQVVAIGNALGYGQSVTVGYVSALNREVTNEDGNTISCIQTDAAINEGNSGGALLNMRGELIGINCAKIASTTVEGMGYAIPISNAEGIITTLREKTTRVKVAEENRGYIGINLQEVTASISKTYGIPVGIFVESTVKGSAAEAAELKRGDVITYFDGEQITSYADLQNLLQYYAAGTTVEIKYMRANGGVYEEHTAMLTLGNRSN